MRESILQTLFAAALALGGALALPGAAPAAERNQPMSTEPLLNGAAVVVESVAVPAGDYTDPDGKVHPGIPACARVRVDVRPAAKSFIRVEAWLPEKWNGRMFGLGNGGAAGGLPTGWLCEAARHGNAAVSTDMGTSAGAACGDGNPEVWEDFGHRATHLMTLVGKELVRRRYGRAPDFCYFQGGSTGGQQALSEAQRYPEDYDGILAEVPAHCRTPLHAYFLWNYQALHGPDGQWLFTPEQEASVVAAGVEYFAARETFPGAKGKFISDPRWTAAEQEEVVKAALARDQSLTPAHAAALRRLFAGPTHARSGKRIFDGLPPGTKFGPACGNLYLFQWVFGKDVDLLKLDFADDFDKYTAALAKPLNAENPDLRAFRQRGGKLLMMSGTADSCVPYHATLDYYERVAAACGGLEAAREFCRFYLLPGREHGGGPGMQWLNGAVNALIAWREKGEVPTLTAGRPDAPAVPVFPYPQRTGPDGKPQDGPRGGVGQVAPEFR